MRNLLASALVALTTLVVSYGPASADFCGPRGCFRTFVQDGPSLGYGPARNNPQAQQDYYAQVRRQECQRMGGPYCSEQYLYYGQLPQQAPAPQYDDRRGGYYEEAPPAVVYQAPPVVVVEPRNPIADLALGMGLGLGSRLIENLTRAPEAVEPSQEAPPQVAPPASKPAK